MFIKKGEEEERTGGGFKKKDTDNFRLNDNTNLG
jgi:hypothetical protein